MDHDFGRTEYQSRLFEHRHCLFWIRNAPVIGVSTPQEVLDFISKYVTCKYPSATADPEMNMLVKRYQVHKCNDYCLVGAKYKGRICRFGFPREVRTRSILHSVEMSFASRKDKSYKKRLYELTRNVYETKVNDYNPVIIKLWKGNMDIQFVSEKTMTLARYIGKYQSKGPKSAFEEFDAEQVIAKSQRAQLLSFGMKALKSREMGCMEMTNYMLGKSPIRCRERFQFLNCRHPANRKSMLKHGKFLENLDDDSEDIYFGNWLTSWYPNRPDGLKLLSLYDFASKYVRIDRTAARNRKKDRERIVTLKNNAGYMLELKPTKNYPHDVIVYGPNLNPSKQTEEFYYSHLLMHVPWIDETKLCDPYSCSKDCYDALKEQYPALKHAVEHAFERHNVGQEMEKKIEEERKAMQEEAAKEPGSADISDYNEAMQFDAARKNCAIRTEEELIAAVDGMSLDQRDAYERIIANALHIAEHRVHRCSCENVEPLRLFIHGGPGCGKSYLIKALMGFSYVESEIKKNPIHFR